jgi:uncharacterized protein
VLDRIRGVAVLGILLINIDALSGYGFTPASAHIILRSETADEITWFLLATLVEAKFCSLFSFLFGVGSPSSFNGRSARGADRARLFKRRLLGLLLIGLIHTLLIWFGDILVTYALLGFVLVPFLRRDDRSVLRWAVAMLVAPIVLYGIGFGLFGRLSLTAPVVGALAFFILQMVLSRRWLRRARFGPAEWLWRSSRTAGVFRSSNRSSSSSFINRSAHCH